MRDAMYYMEAMLIMREELEYELKVLDELSNATTVQMELVCDKLKAAEALQNEFEEFIKNEK